MSDIVIFGGTHHAGSAIAREAVACGHQVTSCSRPRRGSWTDFPTTGAYRTGDHLVAQDDGTSQSSGSAFATAYLDEIEQSEHPRQRLTVGH